MVTRLSRLGAALLVLAALVVAAGFAALQSSWGKSRLQAWLSSATEVPGSFSLTIEGLGGVLPFTIRADRVVLADGQGDWLEVEGFAVNTVPSELWRGRIDLTRAAADVVRWHRLPLDDDPDESAAIPAYLRSVSVGELDVERFFIGRTLLGWKVVGGDAASATADTPMSVSASGRYGFHSMQIDLELDARGDTPAALIPPDLGVTAGATTLVGTLRGAFPLPAVEAQISVADVIAPDLSAQTVAVDVRTGARGLFAGNDYPMSLQAVATGAEAEGVIEGVLAGRVALDAAGRVVAGDESSGAYIEVARIDLRSPALDLEASGRLDDGDRATISRLKASFDDLSKLRAVAGGKLGGALTIEGEGVVALRGLTGDANVDIEAQALTVGDDGLDALLGDQTSVAARLSRDAQGGIRIDDVAIKTDAATATGRFAQQREGGTIDALATVELASAAPLSAWVGRPLAGAVVAQATARGAPGKVRLEATLQTPGVTVEALPTVEGLLRLDVDGLPDAARGSFEVELAALDDALAAGGDISWAREQPLHLSHLAISGPASSAEGDLSVSLEGGLLDGELEASLTHLSVLAPWLPVPIAGVAELELGFSAADGMQHVELDAMLSNLVTATAGGTRIEAVAGEAAVVIDDLYGSRSSRIALEASAARAGDADLDELAVVLVEDGAGWTASGVLSGTYFDPFRLDAAARYTADDAGWHLEVERAEGSYAGEELKLERRCVVERAAEVLRISELDLALAGGRVSGDWALRRSGAAQGAIHVRALPLRLLRLYDPRIRVTGGLDGALVGGDGAQGGLARLELSGERLRAGDPSPDGEDTWSLSVDGHATLRRDRVDVEVELNSEPHTALTLVSRLPLSRADDDLVPAIDADGALSASLDGSVRLELLRHLLPMGEERLAGALDVDLALEGSVARPLLRGMAALENGGYVSGLTGVAYSEIRARATGDGRRLRLESLQAGDGDKGSLTAEGLIDLGQAAQPSYRLAVDLNDMRIVDVDNLRIRAGGRVSVQGDLDGAKAEGALTVTHAEVELPDRLPPEVTTIDVEERNAHRKRASAFADAKKPTGPLLELDLKLDARERVFVRSREIDSEWSGRASLSGSTREPGIEATLSLVRGTANFAGIRITLTEGTISVLATEPDDPVLALVGETSGNGIVARVQIGGRVSEPTVDLESEPPLPQDEIVSRLLFGENPADLTPVQGLQLARVLSRLSGRKSADPLGWIRRTAGLDLLQVGGGEGGVEGSVLSVGKYVGRGVFVSINQGLTTESGTANVEVDLTKHIQLESEIGADATSSIGVNWRWDY